MKSATSVLIAAAGIQQASAFLDLKGGISFDFDLGWSSAKTFPCPGNIINKCSPRQERDWDWSDLTVGSVTAYAGFNFGGWTCEDNSRKRGELQGRTFGLGKTISGSCNEGDDAGLSIGIGVDAGVDLFSVGSFDLSTEFDARLEFHYDMPDGSICKQTSNCKRGGSTIVNDQCGGAKKVRIIYPKQLPQKTLIPKKKCKISCHKIKWHCGKPTSKPTTLTVRPTKETTVVTVATTSSKPGQDTTTAQQTTTERQTTTEQTTTAQQTTDKQSTTAQQTTTEQTTVQQSTTEQTTVQQSTTEQTTVQQTTTTTVPPTTIVTTYDSTSTVFTTSTATITSCGPAVTECPGKNGTHIVTVTVAVSTTVCPVTETRTVTPGLPTTVVLPTGGETTKTEKPTGEKPTSEKPTGEKPTAATSEPAKPTQTPPCPPVVPRCLNTFLELKSKCKNNKDAGCYCPNKEFVDAVFNCIYAHGENGNIISEAVSFFQGICGAYIPENPCIATGADTITQIITVTGTPRITQVPYTTVVVTNTVTESSTTKTLSTEVTIPNINMPPPTGDVPTQPPAATTSVPVAQNPPPVTTTGTGGVFPTQPTGSVPVTAGSGRLGAGLGMVLAAVAFAVAM